ncbi:hypothetical protein RGQ29_001815 [Quercus rubra]|uniref:Retrotransposon Copia-like N-terminal domain-containing protein n=1 Tax=Quercus rubra TaxID=3512 RepID=A0AAN7GIA7_QUERU|nr:hypothetical protein RGQ29_001815 [Quercus rubra]
MAASTSSSSVSIMNQPLLLLSNMSNIMTVKLDNTNYVVWKHQITMVFETYSLFELLEDPQLIPEKSKEKAFLTFMSSTLSPSILALIVGCSTAMEAWKVLENRFSSISRSHILNLKRLK